MKAPSASWSSEATSQSLITPTSVASSRCTTASLKACTSGAPHGASGARSWTLPSGRPFIVRFSSKSAPSSASAHQQPLRDATRRSGCAATLSAAPAAPPHRPRARPLQRLKLIDRIWTHTRIGTADPAALATGRDGAPSRGGTATAAPAALAHGAPAALADGGSGTPH